MASSVFSRNNSNESRPRATAPSTAPKADYTVNGANWNANVLTVLRFIGLIVSFPGHI